MKQSESIENLITALVTFQSKTETLPQTAKGYSYKYTPLNDVLDYIRPRLADVGLAFVQFPSTPPDGVRAIALTTKLMHVSGEWLEDTMILPIPDLPSGNLAQSYGAGLTYACRYALKSILGLATDEDIDAAPKVETSNGQKPEPANLPKPTAAQKKAFHATGVKCYGDEWDDKRPELVKAISSKRADGPVVTSSNDLYRAEMIDLTNGMKKKIASRKEANEAES